MKLKQTSFRVFIQEDDKLLQKKIAEDLKEYNYAITFFSKTDSTFDLLNFNPDILIQDYKNNKVLKCNEWSMPY